MLLQHLEFVWPSQKPFDSFCYLSVPERAGHLLRRVKTSSSGTLSAVQLRVMIAIRKPRCAAHVTSLTANIALFPKVRRMEVLLDDCKGCKLSRCRWGRYYFLATADCEQYTNEAFVFYRRAKDPTINKRSLASQRIHIAKLAYILDDG